MTEQKHNLWEKIVREGLRRASTYMSTQMLALVEDEEWDEFREMSDELWEEYIEGVRDEIIP